MHQQVAVSKKHVSFCPVLRVSGATLSHPPIASLQSLVLFAERWKVAQPWYTCCLVETTDHTFRVSSDWGWQLVVDPITPLVFVLITTCCFDKLIIVHQNFPTTHGHLANGHLVHVLWVVQCFMSLCCVVLWCNCRRNRTRSRREWYRRLCCVFNQESGGVHHSWRWSHEDSFWILECPTSSGWTRGDHDWDDRCWFYVRWRRNGDGELENLYSTRWVPARNFGECRVNIVDTFSHRLGCVTWVRVGPRLPLQSCLQSHLETLPFLRNSSNKHFALEMMSSNSEQAQCRVKPSRLGAGVKKQGHKRKERVHLNHSHVIFVKGSHNTSTNTHPQARTTCWKCWECLKILKPTLISTRKRKLFISRHPRDHWGENVIARITIDDKNWSHHGSWIQKAHEWERFVTEFVLCSWHSHIGSSLHTCDTGSAIETVVSNVRCTNQFSWMDCQKAQIFQEWLRKNCSNLLFCQPWLLMMQWSILGCRRLVMVESIFAEVCCTSDSLPWSSDVGQWTCRTRQSVEWIPSNHEVRNGQVERGSSWKEAASCVDDTSLHLTAHTIISVKIKVFCDTNEHSSRVPMACKTRLVRDNSKTNVGFDESWS